MFTLKGCFHQIQDLDFVLIFKIVNQFWEKINPHSTSIILETETLIGLVISKISKFCEIYVLC